MTRHTFHDAAGLQTRGRSLRVDEARPGSEPGVVPGRTQADGLHPIGGAIVRSTPPARRRTRRTGGDDGLHRAHDRPTLLEGLELALVERLPAPRGVDRHLDVLQRLACLELHGDLERHVLRDFAGTAHADADPGLGVLRVELLAAPFALARGQHGVTATLGGRVLRRAEGDEEHGQNGHGQPENPAGLEDEGHEDQPPFLRLSRIVTRSL